MIFQDTSKVHHKCIFLYTVSKSACLEFDDFKTSIAFLIKASFHRCFFLLLEKNSKKIEFRLLLQFFFLLNRPLSVKKTAKKNDFLPIIYTSVCSKKNGKKNEFLPIIYAIICYQLIRSVFLSYIFAIIEL